MRTTPNIAKIIKKDPIVFDDFDIIYPKFPFKCLENVIINGDSSNKFAYIQSKLPKTI